MKEILHQFTGSLSQSLQGLIHGAGLYSSTGARRVGGVWPCRRDALRFLKALDGESFPDGLHLNAFPDGEGLVGLIALF